MSFEVERRTKNVDLALVLLLQSDHIEILIGLGIFFDSHDLLLESDDT